VTGHAHGRTGRVRGVRLTLLLSGVGVAGVGLAACGPVTPSMPVPLATSVASPDASQVESSPSLPSTSPSAPVDPGPSASHATVVVDEGLLGILPPLVEGATLTVDAETAAGIAAQVAADPGLAGDLEAVAVALYAGEADYAVVTLTRLRDGVFRDDYFRDWRDSFDEAVCAQSGGVEGHAEATIGGRTTFIGTCAGGVRTYHTRLEGPDRIVSLQALGEGRYGERILAGLTE
jgi:hypothetical protein